MKFINITFLLIAALLIQSCSLTPQEIRVKNTQSLLRTACVSSSSSEIGFNLTATGDYELKVTTQTGNANISIDAAVLDKNNQGALNYVNEELRAAQDDQIRECIKQQLPTIFDELRTPKQNASKCYREEADEFVIKSEFKTNEQSARANSPGFNGGKNTDNATLCYNGIIGYAAIEVNFRRTSCLGGRCGVGEIKTTIENNTAKACVNIEAWSESQSYGGGGRVAGYLYGNVSRVLTELAKQNIRTECSASHSVAS
ncbi:MAG: hypothetical protein ACI9SD_001866 [Pseudohongiellaceae bacterium]|jgi:hypothetical protein